jgi:ABC-type antimicrobial peptide transport system permease subunit
MSVTSFPINDLLRRKLQTSLIIISLTLCVASTLFLLLFCENVGLGISLTVENKLTTGFSIVFYQFIVFMGILIFVVGAVMISFLVFVMMSQRIRDIGLMKAAGCPNNLIFGYFMTELLVVAVIGCFLGVILGIVSDFASIGFFSSIGLQISQKPIDFWLVLIVFAVFFALALGFGTKPILDTAKIPPVKAISPVHYLGLSKEPGFKVVSKSGLTIKMALRSLYRHKSAVTRIVLCLIAVFILATIGIAGGIIADQTTKSWIVNAIGRDIILIAHQDISKQYIFLLSKFHGVEENSLVNYTDEKYSIPDNIINILNSTPEVTDIEQRLILETQVVEVPGIDIQNNYTEIGDSHEGVSIIVGVEPDRVLSKCSVNGEYLSANEEWQALIGDSLAQKMFSEPLIQKIQVFGTYFDITGVCLDPINNGNVTYVRLQDLQNVANMPKTNIVMIKIDPSANRLNVLNAIRNEIQSLNPEFEVSDLNEVLDENLGFVGYIWSTIMFLPLLSLFAASLCLIGYVTLTISEQRQEYGVMRALGARPRTVMSIVAAQSFIVSIGSFAAGLAFGIIITLLILIPDPVVTIYTVIEIAGWMLAALALTFCFSVYPAARFARRPLLETMT